MNQNQIVYNLISKLLQYPSEELKDHKDEIREIVHEFQNDKVRESLLAFVTYISETPIEKLWENYVYTFDFHEKTTLYLTYSVYKDNRERGPALVQLRQEFLSLDLDFDRDELPDYLPMILEFAALAPKEQAEKLLTIHFKSIQRLQLELAAINSPYSKPLTACMEMVKEIKDNKMVS